MIASTGVASADHNSRARIADAIEQDSRGKSHYRELGRGECTFACGTGQGELNGHNRHRIRVAAQSKRVDYSRPTDSRPPGPPMKLGFVSAILPDLSLAEVAQFAAQTGYTCVELMCWPVSKAERRYAGVTHVDVTDFTSAKADDVRRLMSDAKVEISALGYYP